MIKLLLLVPLILLSISTSYSQSNEISIDSVIASVNNQPITLSDLSKSFSPAREFSIAQASSDPEARAELDKLILDLLVETDAKNRRIEVNEESVESYISEVAKRNQMQRSEFELALSKDHIAIDQYKSRVKNEILRSRLANALMREGVGVSEQEIDQYLTSQINQNGSGRRIKLRQILLPSDPESERLANEIHQKLIEGADFGALARQYSAGPEAQDDGLIGIVSENDLSQEILDAIILVAPGAISKIVSGPAGYQIFKVEQRFEREEETKLLREEIRKNLEKRKVEAKLDNYFRVELFEKYAVERKI